MKIHTYISIVLFFIFEALSLTGCEEETFNNDDFGWNTDAIVVVKPGEFPRFFWGTNTQSFVVDEVDIHLSLLPASDADDDRITEVEIYAFFQEEDGDNVYYHGEETGKLYKTFTDDDNFNQLEFNVSIDEIYELFKSDLKIVNRPAKLLANDVVFLKWVITDVSGKVTDTRMVCQGNHCQYVISIEEGEACPYNLAGTIHYEVLEKGPYATGHVGKIGSVSIIRKSLAGEFTIDDAEFGCSWNSAKVPGTIFGADDGLIIIENDHDNKWEFISFNGSVCTLKWTNKWDGEWAVVKLTRADGSDWPDYLYGEGQ